MFAGVRLRAATSFSDLCRIDGVNQCDITPPPVACLTANVLIFITPRSAYRVLRARCKGRPSEYAVLYDTVYLLIPIQMLRDVTAKDNRDFGEQQCSLFFFCMKCL